MITLYDNQNSIHATYARVVLDEAGVNYRKVKIDLPFQNLSPDYVAISDAMSIPAMTVVGSKTKAKKTLSDSRDIILYCSTIPGGGGEKLFPKDKLNDIDQVLDQIYSANGGQLAFQTETSRSFLFDYALSFLSKLRSAYVQRCYMDPNIQKDAYMKKAYEAAITRVARPNPSLDVLSERANKVMSYLDKKLEKSDGDSLLGKEYTAADAVAAVWVQWVVWANPPKIVFPSRVLAFLDQAQSRPAWKTTNPGFAIAFITKRLYGAVALLGLGLCGLIGAGLAGRFGN